MTEFLRLVENNDHEGETWTFWLQVDGNEEQLDKLRNLMESDDEIYEDQYQLYPSERVSEEHVDTLVRYNTNSGYMGEHHKITGKFNCPEDLGEYGDTLYKGGIADFFKEEG